MTHEFKDQVSLAPFTTFHIGGPARLFVEIHTEEDLKTAFALSRERGLPLFVLGAGSNVLVPDDGVEGIVARMLIDGMSFEDPELLVAGAGVLWDGVVDVAAAYGVYGIENLAGIPGTLGGAVVQNIGAYGAELKDVFEYADVIDSTTGESRRIRLDEAAFAYRTSLFKEHRELIITGIALRLKRQALPNVAYADLARARELGTPLTTPREIALAVRDIRALKFPDKALEGTAGSFFKNPVIPPAQAAALRERFPEVPLFPQEDGQMKVSLAWLLDHVLSLKGYAEGAVRCYEKQPLVIVARSGATAREVHAFADSIATRVLTEVGIEIEREVESFGTR
ncbi:MAG: UDP-N-acetylmuramate dehydrogenase [Candidatus Paceibacterota bacterium]|jgi:UDP-N-acetylmuramate dehydrogenase